MKLHQASVIGLCLFFTFINYGIGQEMPPAQVSVVEVGKQFMAPKVSLKGNVIATKKGVIAAEVAGQIDDIALVGKRVEKNGSIASINPDALSWTLARAKANAESLKADLIFRNSEVDRFASLAKKKNASKTQLQQAIAVRDMLVQTINMAEADVNEAEKALLRSKVPAPYSGVITERMVEIGEYVSVGDPIARLVNTKQIEVALPTPLDYFSMLKPGDSLTVVRNSEEQLILPIRSIINVGDEQSRMVETRIDAAESNLVVGESVSVLIPVAIAQEQLAIPRDAIIIRGSQTFIYRVANNTAEQIPVDIQFTDDQWLAVSGNVRIGDQLITRGAERLQPGSPVVILN